MIEPINLIYLNNRKYVMDYCEPYYKNETFTQIPEKMRGVVRTVRVLDTDDEEDYDTLVYDYKLYSDDHDLLKEIERACEEVTLMLEIKNGPIRTYTNYVGDTLDITFFFTETEEEPTYDSICKLHDIIETIGKDKIRMHCHISAHCPYHKDELIDLMITTNLFRAIGFESNILSKLNAVFYPNEEGELVDDDYVALSVILGKTLNSSLDTNVILMYGVEINMERLMDKYCKLNKEIKSDFLEYRITSLISE